MFGILGLVTGAIWAKNTWNAYWSWDVKQNMTAIALFIYIAYFILRAAFEDAERKARLSAVYNLFAFVALIPLIFVIPRLTDSLHPGAGGNPALGGEDLDNTMRMIFFSCRYHRLDAAGCVDGPTQLPHRSLSRSPRR